MYLVNRPRIEYEASENHCHPLNETHRAFVVPPLQRPDCLESSPRRQVDSFYGTDQVLNLRTPKVEPSTTTPTLDGTAGELCLSPAQVRCAIPSTPPGNELPGEPCGDVYPAPQQPSTEPPLLASARARRRQARSQDVHMFREDEGAQRQILREHGVSLTSYLSEETNDAPPLPELILPPGHFCHPSDLALDPGAPVFVPRTRFGTAAGSSESTRLQWSGADTFHNSYNLRTRSSSEQNAVPRDRAVRRSRRRDVTIGSVVNHELDGMAAGRRPRRRSGTVDQNIALSDVMPALERYPLMRPPLNANARQYSGSVPQQHSDHASRLHEYQASANLQEGSVSSTQEQTYLHVRSVLTVGSNARREGSSSTRSVSPAISMGSRSTPNLLEYPGTTPRFTVRGSSLPRNRIDAYTPNYSRVPSIVSAASGISGDQQTSRQSSREGLLDAATEFLRMRNSPLDELTERISRLSASRLRSVGRSWDRPPRPRVSLLTGDPFRPDPPSSSVSSTYMTAIEPELPEMLPTSAEGLDTAPEDIIALSLALPPSSPMPSSSHVLPSTPSLHFSESRNPHLSSNCLPESKSPESAFKRKPVPASTATPKVPVYDDSKPPDTQPQTPADARGSRRRAKTRSDTTTQQPPIFVGRVMMSSPPPIPERHPHRNTYPSTASGQSNGSAAISASTTSSTTAPANVPEMTHINRNSRRVRAQRGSEQAENDLVQGHLQGLENDRRTWLNRREDGDMDVTPPREGRFERYLS